MLIIAVGFLLISAIQMETRGATVNNLYHRRRPASEGRLVLDLMTGVDHHEDPEMGMKRAIEAITNLTKSNASPGLGSGRAPSLRKMAAPVLQPLGSRQQGFRARTGQEARLGLGSFFGGLKPTPAAGFRVPTYTPALRNAKKFWDHFVFRRRSDSQSILPITNNQVQQDTCRTLPFLQSVVHENCEKVVLKNNLCFGKCSSVNVPGNEDGLHTFCSYCFPAKFTRKMVQLKCQDSLQVTKVVMMVEECQCEVQKERPSHQNGPFLMDPSLVRNQT